MSTTLVAIAFAAAIDGDTLDWGGHRWRLAAIDTPERGERGYEPAKRRLSDLVAGGVACRDTGERPSHGRRIGVCTLPDGRDVALILAGEGLGAVCHNRPQGAVYAAAERAAQAKRAGIWAARYERKGYCRAS